MIAASIQFSISAIIIVLAGSYLTRFAEKISDETKLGRLLVGSVFLAAATSLPELMVDLHAILLVEPDLATGDLLGSSLINLLILASLSLIFNRGKSVFSPTFGRHSLLAALSIMLTGIVGLAIASRIPISFLGVSPFAWLLVVLYVFGLRLSFVSELAHQEAHKELEISKRVNFRAVAAAFGGYLACSLIILVAAPYLIRAASQIATLSGLGHSFVGTTLVALSTSLPELVATATEFRMGASDLALGTIFGSNCFNMILFFILDVFYKETLFSAVRPIHAVTAFCFVIVSSLAILGLVYERKERFRISEPNAGMMISVIL